jgi:hypothetical protein
MEVRYRLPFCRITHNGFILAAYSIYEKETWRSAERVIEFRVQRTHRAFFMAEFKHKNRSQFDFSVKRTKHGPHLKTNN